jgi:hypothetical protein
VNISTHRLPLVPFAAFLGPRTTGYGFAYAAAIRTIAAQNGATFFYWFYERNNSDEEQRK